MTGRAAAVLVIRTAIAVWTALREALVKSLDDPDGAVRQRLLLEVDRFATRLRGDADLRDRLDHAAAELAVFAVDRYGSEVTAIITNTIERWDGKEASQRIELHVGRDLQFIRINGTIVGGLVGVIIPARRWSTAGAVVRGRAPSQPPIGSYKDNESKAGQPRACARALGCPPSVTRPRNMALSVDIPAIKRGLLH